MWKQVTKGDRRQTIRQPYNFFLASTPKGSHTLAVGACTHGWASANSRPRSGSHNSKPPGYNRHMSTYLALNIHIIFSTKYRTPFLTDEIIEQMHKCLAGIVKGLGALPLEIGGVADHVHILVRIKS